MMNDNDEAAVNLIFTTNYSDIPENVIKKYALDLSVIGDEGYVLCAYEDKITIFGNTRASLLYGIVTFIKLLEMDNELRGLVARDGSTEEFRQAAVSAGMATMRADGVAKAAAGVTTIDEVLRVCGG